MTPRQPLPNSGPAPDAANEVVCPLKHQDGSSCRKRCIGEKRYRSMQEHIRRAHPDYYIAKLPATEESFEMMVNTPPSQKPLQSHQPSHHHHIPHNHSSYAVSNYVSDPSGFYDNTSPSATRHPSDFRRGSFMPTANAAAALAQLHNSRPETDWDPDRDAFHQPDNDPNFNNYFASDTQNMFTDSQGALDDNQARSNHLLPSHFPQPSSTRATSLQPFPRMKTSRPRKSSITESARKGKHERQRSRDQKRTSGDRKALSAEPSNMAAQVGGKRWEDLLDAAASATEEDSRDLTPIPQSPRGSLPPFQAQNHSHFHQGSYNTSPLQNAILPQSPEQGPSFEPSQLEAFPSVESFDAQAAQQQGYHAHHSSNDSSVSTNPFTFQPRPHHQPQSSTGSNFHMPPEGLSSPPNDPSIAAPGALGRSHMHSYSAPQYPTSSTPHLSAQQAPPSAVVQHYCAACHRITPLTSSYACTECICGICRDCVDVLMSMGPDRGARCPRCGTVGGKFKPFMLDLR